MLKSVFKEILYNAIAMCGYCINFRSYVYNYIPTNKTIPNKLAEYSTPENVRTEIDQKNF